MSDAVRTGAVIFAKNVAQVASFYRELLSMTVAHSEPDLVVLESTETQLVIHGIPKHIADSFTIAVPPEAREDSSIKLFFPVISLTATRAAAVALGGRLGPPSKEWEARGFRACDGVDPEGNVVQFRAKSP